MTKVLIVDDDKLVRKGLISAMPWSDFGMQVIGEASNGEKALEFLQASDVDLLLTDLAMPVMSGIELMRIVRKRFPHIHIVVLTLHQDFDYVQEALRLGAIDYIAKVQLEKERFEEVLERISNRIRESNESADRDSMQDRADKDLFYDGDPNRKPGGAPAFREHDREPDASSDERLSALKNQWSSFEWVHNDALFAANIEQLKLLRLPQAKLIGLIYSLTDVWNRLYESIGLVTIELAGSFDYWDQVERWLRDTRDLIRRVIEKPAFSQEVVHAVLKAVNMIQDEIDRQLTSAEVAHRVNMSRSYFSQCFKEIAGKTFNDYLRRARMEKAKEYLLYTNKTILWIAENTGYLDDKYFSRTFREQTGLLPSEFRQANRR